MTRPAGRGRYLRAVPLANGRPACYASARMELRELAERVLFATTLEDKLSCPDVITDERPGSAILAPTAPGRPAGLHFKAAGGGTEEFPGLHRLERPEERGRMLHFFANHELLATELMALVLLRFPDAPAAFRRGVLQTLRDEQEHTRLYVERMRACGLEFGALPVSGYFWRSVAPMASPLDYVAGLSLTFEQANLDFARQFSAGFAAVGDADTAALLQKIYRDEIGHVAYGLKWFRRWKNPGESDWEAFCRQLRFPLSPRRAKGMSLNVEGRRAAGLDPAFIAELDVFSHSKGRTPNVFVFNPLAEGQLAHGPTFTPVKHQAQLALDLANLPQFLGREDDVVLVPRRPAVTFLSQLKQAGFPLPEFVELTAEGVPAALAERKLGRLRPWAWSPDSVKLLAPLFPRLTGEPCTPEQRFHAGIGELYSKAWSAARLRDLLTDLAAGAEPPGGLHEHLCTEADVGVAVRTLPDALAAITAIRARGHHRVVVKEALGLAGSNALRLWEPELLPQQIRWLESACAAGRELVVEPWLERLADFSLQLEMEAGGLRLIGYTGLRNDHRGQFQANWAEPNFAKAAPAAIARLLADRRAGGWLAEVYARLFASLEPRLRQVGYGGPLGVDAFVYRSAEGRVRLKPVVEINPRYTMGRLTLELMRQAAPGVTGTFRLLNRAGLNAGGWDSFAAFAADQAARNPVRLAGQPVPRLAEGSICLTDPAVAQAVLAIFEVTPGRPAAAGKQPAA